MSRWRFDGVSMVPCRRHAGVLRPVSVYVRLSWTDRDEKKREALLLGLYAGRIDFDDIAIAHQFGIVLCSLRLRN